jgi:hypothetical protein
MACSLLEGNTENLQPSQESTAKLSQHHKSKKIKLKAEHIDLQSDDYLDGLLSLLEGNTENLQPSQEGTAKLS